MAEKLTCVKRYRNDARGLAYEPGQTLDVDPALARFLLADAPGCFVVQDEKRARGQNKAVLDAPMDK